MKVRDLLKVLIDGQYIEFSYTDDGGYITAYDMPIYRWNEEIDETIKPFLDKEIEQVYSDVEIDWWDEVDYDYMVVVLKEELK